MLINVEQSIIDYLDKYGFLIENNTVVLDENKLDDKIRDIKNKFKQKRIELKNKHEQEVEKIEDFIKDVGEDVGKDTIDEYTRKLRSKSRMLRTLYLTRMVKIGRQETDAIRRIQKIKSISKKSLIVTSGIAVASILIAASYQVYKDDKDRITKKCSTKNGQEKLLCIKSNRIKALKNRIDFLNSAAVKCNYSKNPVKCRDKLNEEILKVKERLRNETINFGKRLKIVL